MRSLTSILLRSGAAAVALAVAGCDVAGTDAQQQAALLPTTALPMLPATLPLLAGEPDALAYAPGVDALPAPARPLRVVRPASGSNSYAYADAAHGFSDALGDAPPDYRFEHDDADSWAWQGYDESSVYAEPIDGGFRSFYYRPGEESPYFVSDPTGGYGYDDGQLAAVYGSDGGLLDYDDYGDGYGSRLDFAGRYLFRGQELYRAGRGRREPVFAANWIEQRPVILRQRVGFGDARARQPEWLAYSRAAAPRRDTYWRQEVARRRDDSLRTANWQREAFRTPAPPRVIPATWRRAEWARDERRYAAMTAPARVRDERQARLEDRWREQTRRSTQNRRAEMEQLRADRLAVLAARRAGRVEERRAERVEATRPDMRAQREQRLAQRDQQLAARAQREAVRAQPSQARAELIARREQLRAERQGREQANVQRAGREQARAAQVQAREQARQQQAQGAQVRAAQVQAREQARQQRRQGDQARAAQVQAREQARAERAQRTRAVARPDAARANAQRAERAQAIAAQRQAREQAGAQQAQREQARAAQNQQREQARAQNQAREQARTAQRAQREQARAAQTAQRDRARAAQAQAREAARIARPQPDPARAEQTQQREVARAARLQARAERQR